MTSPTVFPPPPNAAKYLISTLNSFPAPAPSFNKDMRAKSWQMPFDATKDPNQATVLYFYDGTGKYQPFVITYGEAMAVPNAAPLDQTPAQIAALAGSVFYTQPAWPDPARALLTTESVESIMGVLWVSNSAYVPPAQPQTQQQTTDSATLQRILAAEQEILAKDNLPPV